MKKNKLIKTSNSFPRSIILLLIFGLGLMFPGSAWAQGSFTIKGTVTSSNGETLPGVNIMEKGTTNGTITNFNGEYTLSVKSPNAVLVFSSIGYINQEVAIEGRTTLNIVLSEDLLALDEVVIIGYGTKKKESVVGSITQADGEELMKAGGVTNIGEALQGRLPGVTTITGNAQPGETALKIFIRGQSSWNNDGSPLILVDGIERSMTDIDMNEIDKISVLKDASATAVFGVKGGNGVILITTKRGRTGKPQLTLSANSTVKMYSKLPDKLDSYEAIQVVNESIMREVSYIPNSWQKYIPAEIAEKYRNPATVEESYIYPNVDWEDVILKDYALDHRVNLSVQGGSGFAKYFGSLAYQSTGDILNGAAYDNSKGYSSEYSYNRFNYRSNLDFMITQTTTFTVNLSGFYGVQVKPYDDITRPISSIYSLGPDVYTPYYPDGFWGIHPSLEWGLDNPVGFLANTGYNTYNKFQINSDFELKQDLDFILKGLSLKGKLSYDNNMTSVQRLIDNGIGNLQNGYFRYYDKETGEEFTLPEKDPTYNYDFVLRPWTLEPMSVNDNTRNVRLNYEVSLFFDRTFADAHKFTALALFKREEYTDQQYFKFPRYREDWVGRFTYDYSSRYFIDINGAYNGSEQFGRGYRFDLFPSAALGWMVTNESFMAGINWLDKLKLRGSYGLVGDDNFPAGVRWSYRPQWASGGQSYLVPSNYTSQSPYIWYSEASVGNPDLQWETALKSNLGVELAVLQNKITADFDYFMEDRGNILILGVDRSVPDFYGIDPANTNSGQVEVKGYELVLGIKHTFGNNLSVHANYSMTDAKDKIIFREDPPLKPDYQKAAGFMIDQPRNSIPAGIMQSWDDIYMSTPLASDQSYRRLGYYDIVDYNCDGYFDGQYDYAPYAYPERPQKTWNLTTGMGYKGINLMVQFYGTQNAARRYNTLSFSAEQYLFYEHRMNYWSKENPEATNTLDAWSLDQAATNPERGWYDASLVRLKTIEISYDFPDRICDKIKISGLKIFANGNNLYLWTDMPDDREFNNVVDYRGDYPTMKRFNFGINLNF